MIIKTRKKLEYKIIILHKNRIVTILPGNFPNNDILQRHSHLLKPSSRPSLESNSLQFFQNTPHFILVLISLIEV